MTDLLLLVATAPPAVTHAPDLSIPWARIVLGLLFCLGLVVVAVLLIRQRQGLPNRLADWRSALSATSIGAGNEVLQIEQRLRITPASQLIILRCAERRYLVHLGPEGAQMLDRLADHDTTVEQE